MATTRNIQKREADTMQTTERTRSGKVFTPLVDIYENNDEMVVMADMPGVDEKTIDITLEQHVLTIEGQVKPYIPEGFNLSYWEYEIGDYRRSFTLTDTIDRDKIEASYKNGVLMLKLPKVEPAKPRKITVKTS